MASGSHGHPPNDGNPPPPHPHMMGYPPMPMGYAPGPGPAYGEYPNNGGPPGYQSYHASGQTQSHSSGAAFGFLRGFILCSCIMFAGIILFSLLMVLVNSGIKIPIFKVETLSVSRLSTSGGLSGDWDARIAVDNPNEQVNDVFNNFQVQIFYKNDAVVMNYGPGFELGEKETKEMNVKASASSSSPVWIEKSKLEELGKERGNGAITFSIKIYATLFFKQGSKTSRSGQVGAMCDEVKVQFQNNAENGTFNSGGNPIDCKFI